MIRATAKTIARLRQSTMLAVLLLSACSSSDECAKVLAENDQLGDEALRLSAEVCKADYIANHRYSSAIAVATSLGELEQWLSLNRFRDSINDPVLRADVLMVEAKYYLHAGKPQIAQQRHLLAIEVYRKFQKHRQLGRALYRAFKVVWIDSNHREALNFAGEALEVAQKSQNKNHEISALGNLVKVFQEVGSLGAAQHALNQQRPMLAEYASVGQVIDADIDQGLVHMDNRKYGLATFSFNKALKSAQGSANTDALRGLNLNLVWAYLELGRLGEAEAYLKQAWLYAKSDGSSMYALNYFQAKLHFARKDYKLANESIIKSISDKTKPIVWDSDVLHQAGLIAQAGGNDSLAIEYFQAAIEASDKLRNSLAFNDLKASMLARKREPYEALFLSYLSLGDTLKAFAVAEQAKSKSFLEAYLQNQRVSDQPYSIATIATESKRIDDLLQHLKFMESSPVVKLHPADDVVASLMDQQILSLFIAQQRLFGIVISKGKVSINELTDDYSSVLKLVRAYKTQPNNIETLQKLGTLLLTNIDLNHRSKHLYVSPDNSVSDLVFSSLHIDGKFLVEHKSISLIPSAGALFEMRHSTQLDSGDDSLVIGNPSNDLPLAQIELQQVAGRLKTDALTGEQANSRLFRNTQAIKNLHLATHSGVGHLGPWIRFADGDMPAKKIAQSIQASNLVVLASCSSAVRDGANLWGSLGGLFLSNGSPSVLVTQWSVEDEFTHDVVIEFYKYFTAGESATQSLAKVQRNAIANGVAPIDWAAYMVLGK